ncbi:MAG: hypothetical protein HYX34_07560, partial [Actinobacteria bacterium]|nr:hypothetical protein [Actinomycetota bacterium]
MDDGAVERMEAAVAELVALDVDGLGDAALDVLVRDLARVARRFDAARARVVGAWEARGGWAADGSKSAAAA